MRHALLVVLLASATVAFAATRDDYGYGWTLQMTPGKGAYRLDLTEPVYSRIGDPGLRDLEVFNSQGQSVPFGPVPREAGVPEPQSATLRVDVPWFAIPGAAAGDDGGVSIHIVRDENGKLRSLDAEARDVDMTAREDIVLDLSALREPVDELEVAWPEGSAVNARYHVQGSSDFETWYTLLNQASVLELAQGQFRLRRQRIDLPGATAKYVRLERLDGGDPVPLTGITAVLRPPAPSPSVTMERQTSNARHAQTRNDPVAYEYTAVGPLPIERVTITLASPNSVSRVGVFSRDRDDEVWRYHGDVTTFRIEAAGTRIEHDDLLVNQTRDRQWRLVPNPPLDREPTLAFGFRPEAFAVLEQGSGPYTLAAGSATARRADYPMAALLGALRAELGRDWAIERATLGPELEMRGAVALVPPAPPKPVKVWVLWGVLIGGALAVVWMVLRLLKAPRPDSAA